MDDKTLLIFAGAGTVALLGYFLSQFFLGADDSKLMSRLKATGADAPDTKREKTSVVPLLQRVGQAAAGPFMPSTREKQSHLRRSLGYAGIYSPSALRAVIGCKFILTCLGVALGYILTLFGMPMLMAISVCGLAGYLSTTIWLKFKIKSNQLALEHGLPDALDLMVVCVEAGLTVDSSMQRVGEELALAHQALSREFGIAHMETLVGLTRAESLKNLGVRTGCAAIQSLSAMLIQADRFGTSIATALRVHGESLRIARQHKAEETAAKCSVKMTFPLVLFIFPATFIVLAGPTMIQLLNSPLFK